MLDPSNVSDNAAKNDVIGCLVSTVTTWRPVHRLTTHRVLINVLHSLLLQYMLSHVSTCLARSLISRIYFPQVLLHVLFEHAAGYALFAVKEVEEIGMLLPQVGLQSWLLLCWLSLFSGWSKFEMTVRLCFRWRRAC